MSYELWTFFTLVSYTVLLLTTDDDSKLTYLLLIVSYVVLLVFVSEESYALFGVESCLAEGDW